MATNAPHVPGATGRKPAPKEVAINLGSRGNGFPAIFTGRRDFIFPGSVQNRLLILQSYKIFT